MNPLATLLLALHHNPDDDSARLALADLLEEENQPERAELTRLHAQLRQEVESPLQNAREARVQELLRSGVAPCVPEVTNSLGMRFALIPPGCFWMGSVEGEPEQDVDEMPRHRVEISRPFYLGVFPVTQREFQAVLGSNPSHFTSVKGADTSVFPVDSPYWDEACEFCRLSGEVEQELSSGSRYRLPTEAEWEYACRGGASSVAATYLGPALHSSLANYDGNFPAQAPQGPYLNRTSRVGSYPANAFGLFDMLGNVWEWCTDWHDASWYHTSPVRDPQGPTEGEERILRGGSWFSHGAACRSASRYSAAPNGRYLHQGFRVVLEWQER